MEIFSVIDAPELKRVVFKRLILCSLSSYIAVNNTKPLARVNEYWLELIINLFKHTENYKLITVKLLKKKPG